MSTVAGGPLWDAISEAGQVDEQKGCRVNSPGIDLFLTL
jgi:hypothetical protein